MKPITYLCFTLLSIFIQFCLMDYINDQIAVDDTLIGSNSTEYKNLSKTLKTLIQKPHALHYRVEKNKLEGNHKYHNYSIIGTSTELASTVFDLMYDENVSVSGDELTTETVFTSSEFDNVTEITLFDKKPSTIKPSEIPKKISTNKCYCNLLYKTCDINCCCDTDCSDIERSLINCDVSRKDKCTHPSHKDYLYMCSSNSGCDNDLQSDMFGYLFCIGRVNLPEKPKTNRNMLNALHVNGRLKWHSNNERRDNINLTRELYVIGQPIMIVTNETVNFLELPITTTNQYCNGYKPIKFLVNENIRCYVKLKDLHMLEVVKASEKTKIASPKTNSANATKMDCSTLHCINWTTFICEEHNCTKYDNDVHEPSCSESHCNNIGVKVEYEFYCNVSSITQVIVKFHVRTISMAIQLVIQEIAINFYMGNTSIEDVVRFSGSPGYFRGLPIIVSMSESNHTQNFFNNTFGRNYFILPSNRDGVCVLTNLTHNIMKFGYNKRMKCRISFQLDSPIHNGTEVCLNIQVGIEKLFGLDRDVFISPYGNPHGLSDDKWLNVKKIHQSNIYGEHRPKDAKLICYNLVPRILFLMAFAGTNDADEEEYSILNVQLESTTKNVTFNVEDLSLVITVDINFIDATVQTTYDYVGSPHLSFHLPKDFFFPSSSGCNIIKFHTTVLYLFIIFSVNKVIQSILCK